MVFFSNMIPIHEENIRIDKQFPVMMSVIKPFCLFLFKILMGSSDNDVRSVTLKCICCEWNVTFKPHNFMDQNLRWWIHSCRFWCLVTLELNGLLLSLIIFMLILNICYQNGVKMHHSIMKNCATNCEGKYLKTCVF